MASRLEAAPPAAEEQRVSGSVTPFGWGAVPFRLRLVLFFIATFAARLLGRFTEFPPHDFSALAPAAGLTLAVLLLEPRRNWIAFLLAGLPAAASYELLFHHGGVLDALALHGAHAAMAASGALLMQRFSAPQAPTLRRVREVAGLTVVSLIAPAASATIAILFSAAGDPGVPMGPTWAKEWAGDCLGIVLVAPLILAWAHKTSIHWPRSWIPILERGLAFGGLALVTQGIFGTASEGRDFILAFPYFTLPFLFWTALRFDLRSAVTACALLAALTLINTGRGLGPFPFAGDVASGHAFLVQTFLAVSALSTIVLAVMMEDRRASEEEVRSLNATLEGRVGERTAELEASEQRFQTLAEAAPVGIFSTDATGICIYVNDEWCRLTSLGASTAIGRSWVDTVHPEDRDRVGGRWEVAREDVTPFEIEFRLVPTDERGRWVYAKAAPNRATDGTFSGFIGTVTDITQRKEAEGELRRAHDELESRVRARTKELSQANLQMKESEQRVRSVIDSASDAFVAVDSRGLITDWNPQAEVIFGRKRAEALGQGFSDLVLTPESDAAYRHALQFAFSTGEGALLGTPTEFLALREGGKLFPAEMTLSPAGSGEGRFFSIFLRDITERKAAGAAIRESESVLRGFFDSAPMMMGLVELLHNDILHISDNLAAARFFGLEQGQTAGKHASELGMPPHHLRLWMSHIRESEQLGRPLHFEYIAETPAGPRTLSVTVCYATRGLEGRPRFAYVAEDTTERLHAEEDLREKSTALENAAEGIARIDSKGCFISVNKAYADLTGFTSEDLAGLEWLHTTHPEDRKLLRVAYQTMLAQGKAEQEVRAVRKDGSPFYQQHVIVSTYDPEGNFIGHYCFVRDITSRKRAEMERDRFFTLSLDMLSIAGMNGYFRRLNPAFEATLGFTIAELQAAPFVHFVHPDDQEKTADLFRQMQAGREIVDFENRVRCKDGSYRWFSWTATPYAAEEIVYAVARDVTERKRAESAIIASLEEKDVLLKEIHHRVKNNLQVISSLLQLQSGYIKDSGTLEIFRESQNRIRSMAMIHEKLYQTESLARIDFEEYATGLAAMLIRSYSTNSGVRLQTAIEKVSLNLDTAVPVGLITNEILSNALKYAFPNNRPGIVRVVLERGPKPASYVLKVSDNGTGIPSGISPENASTLGLRLVKILTAQIGGTLSCTTGGDGTSFCLAFTDGRQP